MRLLGRQKAESPQLEKWINILPWHQVCLAKAPFEWLSRKNWLPNPSWNCTFCSSSWAVEERTGHEWTLAHNTVHEGRFGAHGSSTCSHARIHHHKHIQRLFEKAAKWVPLRIKCSHVSGWVCVLVHCCYCFCFVLVCEGCWKIIYQVQHQFLLAVWTFWPKIFWGSTLQRLRETDFLFLF